MAYRGLTVDGRKWKFKIGRAFIDLRSDEVIVRPTLAQIKGVTAAEFVEAREKGSFSITPGDIKCWIRENIT